MFPKRPIFIIGPARSGTTLLGDCLSQHPSVCYVEEPSSVWRRGNAALGHDMLVKDQATPEIVDSIRTWFLKNLEASSKEVLIEKTPANCLRLEFLAEVFPESRLVILSRDREKVIKSAIKRWQGKGDNNKKLLKNSSGWLSLFRKQIFKLFQIKPNELWDFRETLQDAFIHRINPESSVWGPKIPRMRELRSKLSVNDVVMMQHDTCVAKIEEQVGNWNSEDVLYLAYEDLTMSPLLVIERLCVFCDLEFDESVVSAMAKEIVSPGRT